jgi:hypothetical protein
MTSMNIQTSNDSIVEAIRAIIALDPEAVITYEDEPKLSAADQKELEEIIAADDRGEIEYKTFDKFDRDMKSFLKGLSA